MSFTAFTPSFTVQEAQDATAFKIFDTSTWTGESGNTTWSVLRLFHYAADGTITEYDDYELITGVDTTKFDEYLTSDGHIVEIADLTIDSVAAGDRFEDGYYVVRILYSDGSYATGSEPYYDNVQAFLASARCKARKLPAKITWPLTAATRIINWDIFLLNMYLDAAEDAADLGKQSQFREILALINSVFSFYSVSNCY